MTDKRLYLCSKCCRRCYWNDISLQEHRCTDCRLPNRRCGICDRKFEPLTNESLYCKRCDFFVMTNKAIVPAK